MVVLESAPRTTPPSNCTAMIVVWEKEKRGESGSLPILQHIPQCSSWSTQVVRHRPASKSPGGPNSPAEYQNPNPQIPRGPCRPETLVPQDAGTPRSSLPSTPLSNILRIPLPCYSTSDRLPSPPSSFPSHSGLIVPSHQALRTSPEPRVPPHPCGDFPAFPVRGNGLGTPGRRGPRSSSGYYGGRHLPSPALPQSNCRKALCHALQSRGEAACGRS